MDFEFGRLDHHVTHSHVPKRFVDYSAPEFVVRLCFAHFDVYQDRSLAVLFPPQMVRGHAWHRVYCSPALRINQSLSFTAMLTGFFVLMTLPFVTPGVPRCESNCLSL